MDTVNGLPAHILLVHAVVVLLPLASLLLVLTAFWPTVRRRLAAPNAILSSCTLVLVWLTMRAGHWLEHRVPETDLVREHADLGNNALFVALPVAVVALVTWWRQREAVRAGSRRTFLAPRNTALTWVVAAVSVIVAGAAVYNVYRIGDSGARASWTGNYSTTSTPE